MAIVLNKPLTPNLAKLTNYLAQVNESGWYTNFGPLHKQLTERLEKYLGVENLLLVSNGTLALQVAYKALGVNYAITTPFSFVATASSLIWSGIDTSFSDIEESSYNLCPKKVEEALITDSKIDCIVATHVYGNPCDVDAFNLLSEKYKVRVIYDAAHAFGVKVGDKSVLEFGDASTLSFHATKVFHTIEGGAIVFKHKADYERAKRLVNFGIDNLGNITEPGINAKLNEYQCAVGLTILDSYDGVLEHRIKLFNAYTDGLKNLVGLQSWHPDANFNGAYMPINLNSIEQRIKIEQELKRNNVQYRQYFTPSLESVFQEQKVYSNKNSKILSEKILCLPLHIYMSIKEVEFVVNLIKKVIK